MATVSKAMPPTTPPAIFPPLPDLSSSNDADPDGAAVVVRSPMMVSGADTAPSPALRAVKGSSPVPALDGMGWVAVLAADEVERIAIDVVVEPDALTVAAPVYSANVLVDVVVVLVVVVVVLVVVVVVVVFAISQFSPIKYNAQSHLHFPVASSLTAIPLFWHGSPFVPPVHSVQSSPPHPCLHSHPQPSYNVRKR